VIPDPRVYRIAFSTNVERVALALAHKGVRAQWVDVDADDRSPVERISGQDLVPVLVAASGEVISDSMAIVDWLERQVPEPALWPAAPARRAEVDVFIEWFNRVWKVPPNAIAAERDRLVPDTARLQGWNAALAGWLFWFEALLEGREFLMGDAFGAADVCAFPFLKYGVLAPDPDDGDPFHAVLADHLPITQAIFPRLADWVERVDALPRA